MIAWQSIQYLTFHYSKKHLTRTYRNESTGMWGGLLRQDKPKYNLHKSNLLPWLWMLVDSDLLLLAQFSGVSEEDRFLLRPVSLDVVRMSPYPGPWWVDSPTGAGYGLRRSRHCEQEWNRVTLFWIGIWQHLLPDDKRSTQIKRYCFGIIFFDKTMGFCSSMPISNKWPLIYPVQSFSIK